MHFGLQNLSFSNTSGVETAVFRGLARLIHPVNGYEECYPDPPMIGRTALERARVRELERIAELGVLLPVGRIIHATNSPLGLAPNPGVAAHFRSVLPEALRVLDARLSDGRPFVTGDRPSIGLHARGRFSVCAIRWSRDRSGISGPGSVGHPISRAPGRQVGTLFVALRYSSEPPPNPAFERTLEECRSISTLA